MVTYLLDERCLAAIAGDEETEELPRLIRCCLASQGLEPWERMAVDAFSMNGLSLLLARPVPPPPRRLYRYKK